MNTVVNLSSPLVTRLASSIQLGRRERERGTAHDALSLQQSRAGGESHWFDIRRKETESISYRSADERADCYSTKELWISRHGKNNQN
ncbi:hypothetical protein BDE02_14G143900 [Populus trichocarpa]|nr:hypothetical protein BDE02_14G143900 [Populus trichocarpa]